MTNWIDQDNFWKLRATRKCGGKLTSTLEEASDGDILGMVDHGDHAHRVVAHVHFDHHQNRTRRSVDVQSGHDVPNGGGPVARDNPDWVLQHPEEHPPIVVGAMREIVTRKNKKGRH